MKDSLVSFPRLETLLIGKNEIALIDPSLFRVLPALKTLEAWGNSINQEQKELFLKYRPTGCIVWGL